MAKLKPKQNKPVDLIKEILQIFKSRPNQAFNYKQISKAVAAYTVEEKDAVISALDEFAKQKTLKKIDGKYMLNKQKQQTERKHFQKKTITGTVDMTMQGFAFIASAELEKDIFVSQNNLSHALNGDLVKINIYSNKKTGRPEGEVVEIINRAKKKFVGKIEMAGRNGFLVCDDRQMPYDIFIPAEKLKGAENGQKVVGEITDWEKKARNPMGQIVDVLGNPGENDTEMHAILAEFDLPYRFPELLEKLATKINDKITSSDYSERRDFRDIATFTIDPADAKDFDDALSIQSMKNGNVEVGVHIADVTHYVLPDSAIDKEAAERATSVYLVDRTVPMLPERLSNFLCSLRPEEEKLCFSAVFEMDAKANIVSQWLGRTVIKSKRRFNYDEAQKIIETGQGDFCNEIVTLNKLAKILRDKRLKSGAMNFEKSEAKFVLDEKGKPLNVFFKEIKESNNLIEEFMLLANKKVAEFVGKKKTPKTFVYRVHDKPDETKFEKLKIFIKRFGYSVNPKTEKDISKELNKLIDEVKDKPEANIIETLALRSMAKAIYSTENIGHYGLAFPFYTHFTSPIRRYPDMMVHRLLAHYLQGSKNADKDKYETLCKHSSEMEQLAAEAERASIKYKMAEFLQDKIGTIFDGIITGVTEWGIYVEICENKIEGMISIREMRNDYYYFDEENYCIVGKTGNKKFTIGDKVKIKVTRTDLDKKQIDFALVEDDLDNVRRKRAE